MIEYNGVKKEYVYDKDQINQLLDFVRGCNLYNSSLFLKEKCSELIEVINEFSSSIKERLLPVKLSRKETESEARSYFGKELIDEFDGLLTSLDNDEVMVALHGTLPETAKTICETGLQYKLPNLTSTAVLQNMNYGSEDMHYKDYSSLLNWIHREYKGLVILGIPYECFYKEGLWNKFKDEESEFSQNYRIDPDFIVGYLDVENKRIVRNPKYSRKHNYEGYVPDNEAFHKREGINNDDFKNMLIDGKKKFKDNSEVRDNTPVKEKEVESIDSVLGRINDDVIESFNYLRNSDNLTISDDVHKTNIDTINYVLDSLNSIMPSLKTEEELRLEEEQKKSEVAVSNEEFEDWDWDFDEGMKL